MTEQVVILITTLLAIELFLRLPFLRTFQAFVKITKKALSVIRAKSVSEHRKELVLVKYSRLMMRCSLQLLLYVSIIVCLVLALDAISRFLGASVLDALSSWSGISTSVALSVVYVYLRNRLTG